MSESVLAALDTSSSEAGHESPQSAGTGSADTGRAGAAIERAADAGGDGAVHQPASGSGAGSDAGNQNPAEAPKLVPLAALHEARSEAKALKTQIAELEKRRWLSDDDAQLLEDLKAQRKAAAEPKAPEFLEDPKGYIDHKEKQVSEALKQLREGETRRSEAEKQQTQLNQLLTSVASHEQAFVAANPDYHDALNHVRTVRASQLKMMFPDASDAQVQQQIRNEELGGAHQILARGGNPAEFAYNYAKTLGYVKKQAAAAIANGANGAAPVLQQEIEQKPDKDAVRSLGGGGAAESDDAPASPMPPEFHQALKERFTRKRK